MQIGIIGAGSIGRTAAGLFVDAGHEVALSNSRGPESLSEVVADLGPRARAVTPVEAAEWGETVLLALPFRHREELPEADRFGDAVVIDATNPYTEDFEIMDLGDDDDAKSRVAGLIEDAGFAPVDMGSLREGGRHQQPGSAIYNEPLPKSEAERRLQELRD